MANLIVRNVDEKIIKALKARAGRRGVSAEAEHREILAQALLKSRKRSFAEVIAAMPNVGKDSDFERVEDDTNVISEARKRNKANRGVRRFFDKVRTHDEPLFVSVITVGEIRRGIEIIRHRGDNPQARRLEAWLEVVLRDFDERILEFGNEEAQVWGRLRVPYHENAIDKQIAATALTHDLILVTRNVDHFKDLGVRVFNPFD